MNVVLIIIGICAIIGGFVAFNMVRNYKKEPVKKILIIPLVGLLLFTFGFSFAIVPTGYTGVRTTFGQISEEVVPHGFNMKIPFAQSILLVNNKQQDITLDAQVWGESIEKTPVYASNITITYQINSDKSAWIYSNISNTKKLITQGIVASAIKSSMAELHVEEVTIRSKIEPMVKENLAKSIDEKYGEGTIEILKVVINQMDFEDSYNQAIAAKSIAQQEQAKQEIENATAVAKAEADKKVAITNAEAKAESTRIAAEAEAEANKLLEESLTDAVLQNRFYDTWDGKLPQVVGSNDMLIDIPIKNGGD
jgi:regulator of protease activity HflC (stomatin/prohibitin superfamily)